MQPRERIQWYNTALIIAQRLGDVVAEGKRLNNLSLAHRAVGETHQAINYQKQSLVAKMANEDRKGQGMSSNNLA